jgi:hypothetical protein
MKIQMALFVAPLFLPPAAMAQQTVTVPSLSTIMLPSLNADGGALSHVTNLPTSFIPTASVPIAVSTAGTAQLVAAVSAKAIYVTDWDVLAGGTGTFQLEYGTGTNCATGTTALTGTYPMTAQFGRAGVGHLFIPASNALCIVTTGAAAPQGFVAYAQQ